MVERVRPRPVELAPGWPDTPSQDAAGESARQFASNLRAAIGPASIRSVAREAAIHHLTILNILNGSTWPDLYTVAKLEIALGVRLWRSPID
jgi:hypothetical protein